MSSISSCCSVFYGRSNGEVPSRIGAVAVSVASLIILGGLLTGFFVYGSQFQSLVSSHFISPLTSLGVKFLWVGGVIASSAGSVVGIGFFICSFRKEPEPPPNLGDLIRNKDLVALKQKLAESDALLGAYESRYIDFAFTDKELLKLLLETGRFDLNACPLGKSPLLHTAIENYKITPECLQLLLSTNKIDVNMLDRSGRCALDVARRQPSQDLAEMLTKYPKPALDINFIKEARGSLWVQHDKAICLDHLIAVQYYAETESESKVHLMLCYAIAMHRHRSVDQILKCRYFDLDKPDHRGISPIAIAKSNPFTTPQMYEVLQKHGAR